MKHIFVINPAAGKGKKIPAILSAITYACEEIGADYQIYHTATVGDGSRFVSKLCNKYPNTKFRFYACGGDGTLFEVLNGAVGHDNAEISVIPLGTGNDFIKAFSKPEYFTDVKRQLLGKAEKLDVLKYNNRYSLNVINMGFDCDVVQKVGEIKRSNLVPSQLAYGISVANVLTKEFGKRFKVTLDGEEPIEKEFTLCAVCNANCYGDGYRVAPQAILNDGLMDVCLVDKISRATFIRFVSQYKAGQHINDEGNSVIPFLRYKKCKKVTIESVKPMGICADGEISPFKKVEITCLEKAIAFSIPKGSVCLSYQQEEEPCLRK